MNIRDLEIPILQAPIEATIELAAIVSETGAIGSFQGNWVKPDIAVGVQVGTARGAKIALSQGADFLICQGVEAGGHVQSTIALETLLPQVLSISGDIPVLRQEG